MRISMLSEFQILHKTNGKYVPLSNEEAKSVSVGDFSFEIGETLCLLAGKLHMEWKTIIYSVLKPERVCFLMIMNYQTAMMKVWMIWA